MKQYKIKFRIKPYEDSQVMQMIITYPMETGWRREKSGAVVPAYYISQLHISLDEVKLIEYDMSNNVSKYSFFSFVLNQEVVDGQKVKIEWRDNHNIEKNIEVVSKFDDKNKFLFSNYEQKSRKRKRTPNKVPALIKSE